jgi:hypothetical protein
MVAATLVMDRIRRKVETAQESEATREGTQKQGKE